MRIFIVAITLGIALMISLADVSTGLLPEITIFGLVPVIVGTYYLGFKYGLFVAFFAAASELVAHLLSETGAQHTAVITDTVLHTLIYVLTAALIARLVTQLRNISSLEELRNNDLDIAKRVHGSVFAPVPGSYRNLSIGSNVAFARELGGDYYYIAGLKEQLFFCIADISGKSIAAALFAALLNESVTEALEHTLDLTTLVDRVNSRMSSTLPEDMFVTMFCALIDENMLTFVNVGHPPAILYSKQEGSVNTLQSNHALPIGIKSDLRIETTSVPFGPGDIFLATTDGITESSPFREGPYEKLIEMLSQNAAGEAQDIADIIFTKAVPGNLELPLDDVIVVCIKKHP